LLEPSMLSNGALAELGCQPRVPRKSRLQPRVYGVLRLLWWAASRGFRRHIPTAAK
jgi:hypothetical protein